MDHDLIIIGGGPSGLSTALHLERIAPHLATRILILEKEQYPRFKLCAGGLTLDAEILLERLGLDVNEVPHVTADNIHFDFAGKGLNIRICGQHALRVIRRNEFDHWLAKKAEARGIEIREGVTVKNIITQADKVIVETDQGIFEAQAVVGADGSNGITRRILFPNAAVYTARVLEVITPLSPHRPPGTSPNFSEIGGGREGVPISNFPPSPIISLVISGTSPPKSTVKPCAVGAYTIRTYSPVKNARH